MKSFLYTILAVTSLLPAISLAAEKPETAPEVKAAAINASDTKQKEALDKVEATNKASKEETTRQEATKAAPEPVTAIKIPEEAPKQEAEKPLAKPEETGTAKLEEKTEEKKAEPITLSQALAAAYKTNPDLKTAIKNLEATNELAPQALSEWLPRANLDMDFGKRQSKFGSTPRNSSNVNSKVLSISQPIFQGTFSGASDRAANTIKSEQFNLQSTEQQLLLTTITVFMDVITNEEVLKLAKNRVEILERQLDETNARFEVGELTRTDISQAGARLASAVADQSIASARLESSRANFERLTGLEPKNLKAPEELPKLPGSYPDALAAAKKNNPDLNYAKYNEKAAEDQVDINTGQLLPKLSLNAAASREQDNSFSGADFSNDSIVLNVNVPLYQGGAEYSEIRESKKRASAATYQRISAMNAVVEQSRIAWKEARISATNIKSTQKAVDAAEIALEGVRAEENEGLRTIIDVLDAEQELFAAKTSLLTAKRDQMVAYYSLLDTIGELTAQDLGLQVELYDKDAALDDVKYQFIGF